MNNQTQKNLPKSDKKEQKLKEWQQYAAQNHLSGEWAVAAKLGKTGFTEEEMTFAQSAGMQVCTLGPRILRCETAPLCALTAVLFSAGEYD